MLNIKAIRHFADDIQTAKNIVKKKRERRKKHDREDDMEVDGIFEQLERNIEALIKVLNNGKE